MRVIFDLVIKSLLLVFVGIFIYEIPFLYHEVKYMVQPFDSYQVSSEEDGILDTGSARIITPESTQFGLIVPKIGINQTVHEDGLTHETGIYHDPKSNKPGSKGEVIIKTFSSDKELINRNNSIFPITHRLIPGDEILVFYNGKAHKYFVAETKIVPSEVYSRGLNREYNNSLRLDVNWPPGLYTHKLLIYATLTE